MTLYDLKIGEQAIIAKVKGRGAFRKRLTEMGFIPGKKIIVIRRAPLRDPIVYNIMGYEVTLRQSEAKLIEIASESEVRLITKQTNEGTIDENILKSTAQKKGKTINVAFVGNPNSGKTTIFNHASHSRERVGNYGGVTISAKEAKFRLNGYTFRIVDLPGSYSLSAYSPEEVYVRDHIIENVPDIVVNVIDASNIERNLYLTTQLIDMDIKVVVALNMYDELEKNNDRLDDKKLGAMLGVPFVPTIGSKGKGINDLFSKIIEVYEGNDPIVRHIHINYGRHIEQSIRGLQELINIDENIIITSKTAPRFLAIKLLEKDEITQKRINQLPNSDDILNKAKNEIAYIEKHLNDDTETLITDARYGFIAGALKQTLKLSSIKRVKKSAIIDTVLTHKIWGIPIFIFFMWLTFFLTFKLGSYPMELIDSGISLLSGWMHQVMSEGMLKDLFVNGVIGGVGSVLVFLPNILILYLIISLMEDTGYMARAVFIMDKAMHRIGLHGKSFIPLLMGFGCNVPAILSTRIIESKRDRLITILINPFMSCSARLPVYVLLISAFFPSYQGTMLFLVYFIGVGIAVISAFILQKIVIKKADIPFVMELPPYRRPTTRSIVKHMWHRTEQYIKKITGIVLIASVIIWALNYFPKNEELTSHYETRIAVLSTMLDDTRPTEDAISTVPQVRKDTLSALLQKEKANYLTQRQKQSYIGRLGHFIQPVMAPLGFDWKMSVAILTGITAKEIIVGTLGVLYQAPVDEVDMPDNTLIEKLRNQRYESGPNKGEIVFTPLAAFTFMIFILIYFPCVAVVAAIKKETGSWKWPLFSVFFNTSIAWIVSFLIYQIGSLTGL